MFKNSTKEAIKVGLAVSLTIFIAFWLGWEKSYWSAIVVYVVAANETYSHAIAKAGNRVLGTVLGICFAIFLISYFSQDRVLFILFLSVFLVFAVFMTSHKRYGYAFKMSFTVCIVISCVGGFNNDVSITTALLRIQETILGVVVYSLIFRLIWPKRAQDLFFEEIALSVTHARSTLSAVKESYDNPVATNDRENQQQQLTRLYKLNDILDLPLNDSPRLVNEVASWRLIINAFIQFEALMAQKSQGKEIPLQLIQYGGQRLLESIHSPKSNHNELKTWCRKVALNYPSNLAPVSHFNLPLAVRLKNAFKAVSVLWTCLAMWIYMPIPGGYMMPLVGAIFANVLASIPARAIKFLAIAIAIWGSFFISQYIFITPHFTETWQICLMYFFNGFLIWKTASMKGLEVQKKFVGHLSVVLVSGGLKLTPSFTFVTPVTMLVFIFIVLGVTSFYNKLYSPSSVYGAGL